MKVSDLDYWLVVLNCCISGLFVVLLSRWL